LVVVAGALPLELKHIRALGRFSKVNKGGIRFEQGVIRGMDVALVVSGAGDARAYSAAGEAIRLLSPKAYLSVGLSGGLAKGLTPGEVVVGESTGFATGKRYLADKPLLERVNAAIPCRVGPLLASERVIVTSTQKRAAGAATKCIAVDMESCGAARAAEEAGVPFLAIRAVSDTVDEDLPVDFNRFMKGGGMDWASFIPFMVTHPGTLPKLMDLGRKSGIASRNLAAAFSGILSAL
jgi:adenosylhomocysteine nucleosidase